MKHLIVAGLVVFLITTIAFAQKRTTIIGDAWVGVVESSNETTREIKIVNPDKQTESFVGVLKDGYQVTLKAGGKRELLMSEIKPGVRIRVFYKSKTIDVGGRDTNVKLIHRVDFMGRDDYTQLRELLKLQPSLPVSLTKSDKLPEKDPLKLHVAVQLANLAEVMVQWANYWNSEQSAKYGRVEIVGESAQADVSLVVIWWNDDPVILAALPIGMPGEESKVAPVVAYLASKDDKGLNVSWQERFLIDAKAPQTAANRLAKELEKRLKARSK